MFSQFESVSCCGTRSCTSCARPISLARLLVRQGKHDGARDALRNLRLGFTEGFDTAELKDAKAMLDKLKK